MVRADSSEADDWPSRKPSKSKRLKNVQDAVLGQAGGEAVRRAAPVVRRALAKGAKAALDTAKAGVTAGSTTGVLDAVRAAARKLAAPVGTAAGVGGGTTAVLLAAAGMLSYWVTKKILEIPANRRADRAAKAAAAADAFKAAHRELAEKLKRPLTVSEAQGLGKAFKVELAKLGLSSTDLGGL